MAEEEEKRTPIKLGRSTWLRSNAREPRIPLVNRYFEENPANRDDQVALITRPALLARIEVGDGPIREMYYSEGCFNNDMFVVSGEDLFRVERGDPDIATQIVGAVVGGDSDTRPSMTATRDPFLFVADSLSLFVYDEALDTYTEVAVPDDAPVVSTAYIKGFVVVVIAGSQRFYWILPNEKTIDPLNFAEAETFPDFVVQAMPLGDQFALFGRSATEFWTLTGDELAPFQKVQGRTYDRGVWNGTPVKFGDAIVLVSNDGVVYKIEGGPKRISYPAIEERIRRAMKIQEES